MPLTADEAEHAAEFAERYRTGRGSCWHIARSDYYRDYTAASYTVKQALAKSKRDPKICEKGLCSPHMAVALLRGVRTEEAWSVAEEDVLTAALGDLIPHLQGLTPPAALVRNTYAVLLNDYSGMLTLGAMLRRYAEQLRASGPVQTITRVTPDDAFDLLA